MPQGSKKQAYRILPVIFLTVTMFAEYHARAQPVAGDSIVSISLQQAIDLGVKHSYKLKAASLAVEQGNESVKQKKAERLPDVNVGITGYLINDPTLYNEKPFGDPQKIDYTPYQVSGNLTISQAIYAGSRIKNSINQQEIQRNITALLESRTTADVKMIIVREYLQLYTLLKDYEVNVQTIDQIELRLKTLRSKYLNGQVVKNDVSRSELQKSDFELKLIRTISNASVSNYFLTKLLGLSGNAIIQVDTTHSYAADTLFVFDDILVTAFQNRAEYQIAERNKELSENTLRMVKGAYYPTVNAMGLYGMQNPVPNTFPPEGKFLSYLTVGVAVNYNISSFYRLKHQQHASELGLQRELANIKDLEVELSENVKTQLAQYEVQRQSLAIYRDKVRFALENYKIVKSRYYNDLALISEIVDAELEYNQARLDLIKGEVQTRIDYYQLLKAIGTL